VLLVARSPPGAPLRPWGGSQQGGLFGPGAVAMRGKLVAPFVSQRLVAVEGEGNEADLATLAADALRYVEDGNPRARSS
jgi:hypothetical protein